MTTKTKRLWVLVTPRGRVCWETVADTRAGACARYLGPFTEVAVARRRGYRFKRVRCEVEK